MIEALPKLRRFAHGLCQNAAMAEDVFQDACEKAIRSIDQWDPKTRLDSWMFKIVRNTFLDLVRTQQNRQRLLSENISADEEIFDGVRAQHSRMELDVVKEGLKTVPEDQRSALLLVTVEGYSYKEAAEILGIPMGTLTSRLSRAREHLKDVMEQGVPSADGKNTAKILPLKGKG